MTPNVLVQFRGIDPPTLYKIRVIPPKEGSAEGRGAPELPTVQLRQDEGGCRSDTLLYELYRSGYNLVDLHIQRRLRDGRELSVINMTYSIEGEEMPLPMMSLERWWEQRPKRFRDGAPKNVLPDAFSVEQQRALAKFMESYPDRFTAWVEGLFFHSWMAGRAFVRPELICVNLTGCLALDARDNGLTIEHFLKLNTTHAQS